MARVLIVDDAAFMRIILRKMIVVGGHDVVGEAADGDAALRLFHELSPDVITLDITMPGMDGIEVLREVLAIDPEARVIMITAAGQKNKVVECMELGAADFIEKPFEADRVLRAIDQAMAAH